VLKTFSLKKKKKTPDRWREMIRCKGESRRMRQSNRKVIEVEKMREKRRDYGR